jgi:hypothetical protein
VLNQNPFVFDILQSSYPLPRQHCTVLAFSQPASPGMLLRVLNEFPHAEQLLAAFHSLCFAGDTVGDLFRIQGTINQYGYHNILQQNAISSGLSLVGISFVFQQDNDPTHHQAV